MADWIKIHRDGREVLNLKTAKGRMEYRLRIKLMLERQKGICCLSRFIPQCPGGLLLDGATFEHEDLRCGGRHDDRIEVDGLRRNGAAHWLCNSLKGSRRFLYNKAKAPSEG